MYRTRVAAVLAVVTAASLLVAPHVQAAPAQQIQWQKCFDTSPPGFPAGGERLECGSFTAPMDWNNPRNGKTITIAVSRLTPLNSTAKTTIFTNPGGPGIPGLIIPLLYLDRPKLSGNAEIIGIDVRGTGASTNVACGIDNPERATDPRDRSKANLDLIYGGMDLFAKSCQTKSGELGRYVTTDQTVKDFDLLRQILGKRKVSLLMYSGGTWMGAHYATYFPKTLDKIVLDSNVEFTRPWQNAFDDWGMGFERRFRLDFLPWVAKYDDIYHLGKTAEEVRQSYERTRAKLNEQPVQRPEALYDGVELDFMLRGTLYQKAAFVQGAQIFAGLAGTAPGPIEVQPPIVVAQAATTYSILCNDTPFSGDRKFLEREAAVNGAKWPLVGYYQLMGPCAFWDRPNVELKQPTGIGVPTTLMVQSVHDPSTTYEGAQRAHENFKNSVMLTVNDEGDHGIYGFGNKCVADIVESYFIDGVTPTKDLTCPGVPLPTPADAGQKSLSTARQLATQLGW
ncbi:TAP-like protein [Lentzea waywayandensis]|uniref:TAP-like protein n=1 Tax=Lentzea waywayandensis TaxID=84724 RepID=A0A1I6FJP0_9PSEU|nr:alpha/beta hydrolase [Lentzea waywayandensis]SFR30173.1 TAP-like protein [Lentzea waywayandensis]